MTDLYDETDYFGTPESRDRDARMVGHEVEADTSKERVERHCNKIIAHVHDGRALWDSDLGGIIDSLRALLAERDALESENKRLRDAGQAIVDRWDTPWKYAEATAHVIDRLRAALKGDNHE